MSPSGLPGISAIALHEMSHAAYDQMRGNATEVHITRHDGFFQVGTNLWSNMDADKINGDFALKLTLGGLLAGVAGEHCFEQPHPASHLLRMWMGGKFWDDTMGRHDREQIEEHFQDSIEFQKLAVPELIFFAKEVAPKLDRGRVEWLTPRLANLDVGGKELRLPLV